MLIVKLNRFCKLTKSGYYIRNLQCLKLMEFAANVYNLQHQSHQLFYVGRVGTIIHLILWLGKVFLFFLLLIVKREDELMKQFFQRRRRHIIEAILSSLISPPPSPSPSLLLFPLAPCPKECLALSNMLEEQWTALIRFAFQTNIFSL